MSRRRRRGPLDVAIVGMACRFPGAGDLFAFGENILAGVDATSDVPPDRWPSAEFFDPASAANDRVACRRGGYLESPIPFDPAAHGIMPHAVDGGEPEQFVILDAARAALADAGLAGGVPDGRRAQVIIGRGNYFNRGNLARLQHGRIASQTVSILRSLHPDWPEADFEAVRLDLKASLPPFGPATVPGQLTNATAGRVADRLDLLGPSFVVDAASASALVALDLGARALAEGRADLALVGAVYLEADVDFAMVFGQLGAASPSGRSRPFAKDADGMVPGEGAGVVVLKRRGDAERDGDRIYAVVRGVGVAGDGRGAGLAAPDARGHARAIRRAYRDARVDPATVGLVEGHGLGVPAADRAELRALRATFPPVATGRRVLGAVSSTIGHAMPAAGMAGLIRAALALHHRVLPPTLHAEPPHPLLDRPDSPFAIAPEARPWVHGDPTAPRRAGVSAFGFAGINAHAVLESHDASADAAGSPGALLAWDGEAILLAAPDREALAARARSLLARLEGGTDARLKDIAATINAGDLFQPARLGLVATSPADLAARLAASLAKLDDRGCRSIRDARGAYFWDRPAGSEAPRMAFLFPGEGSQYPGMLADLCPHFPEVRALFDTSDRIAREAGADRWPSEHLFTHQSGEDPGLWSAGVAANVVLSAQWALYQLLIRLGLRPDAVVGHSSGELLALAAAGVVAVDRTFEARLGELGALFAGLESSGDLPTARLVAVAADRGRVEAAIREVGGGSVAVAMDNCPHQVVVAGPPAEAEAVVARLRAGGAGCEVLPFARAYHTAGFAPALGPIAAFFGALDLGRPRVPLYSCASTGRMPDDPEAIRRLAVAQWTRPVAFRETVEAMHGDGLRVFVDVGARGNLAGFVEDTLRGRPAFAVAANLPRRSGLAQLNHLVASLFARGVALDPAHLYARRRPHRLDLDAPPRKAKAAPALAVGFPTMHLSGAMIDRLRAPRGDGPGTPAAERVDPTSSFGPREGLPSRLPRPAEPPGRNGFHPARNGHADHPALIEVGPRDEPEASDATMLDFQSTLDAFLEVQKSVMDAYRGVGIDSLVHEDRAPRPSGPWAGELVSLAESREAVSRVTIAAAGDPVAEHHTLGGRRISALRPEWRGLPVLPFSVMAEMLAEAGARLVPGGVLVGLLDVRAHRWIRFEDEPVVLELRATVDPAAPGRVGVAIHNRGPARASRTIEAAVFEGVAVFEAARPGPPAAPAFALEGARPCRFTAGSIYEDQWLFHGPALRAVVGIGPIARGGIEGTLRVLPLAPLLRDGLDAGGLLTDPIILDNFTHLLGAWGLDELADDGDVIFPLGMGRLAIFGPGPPAGSDVACRITVRELERHRARVDADLVGPDGRTWMEIRDWEDWRFRWPGRYRDGFRQPDRTLLGEALPIDGQDPGAAAAVWLEPPADMGRPVWRDVLEHVQLGPDERAALLAPPGPDARRTDRLWGRIAAKEAARRLWLDRGHPPVYPADLLVDRDPLGRPSLRSRAEPGRDDLPAVSIAHVEGVAVALACSDPARAVGIDVEPIVERSRSFEATAFLPGERALLDGRPPSGRAEWVARLWCAKEAAAKATGLGFVEGPSGVEVVAIGDGGAVEVRLRGALAAARPGLAIGTVRVVTARRGDFAWAWTLGERGNGS